MARRRTYSKKTLAAAVQAYFDSITREIEIKERVDNGKRDSYGHVIYDLVTVKNKLGEVAKTTEYLVPPTLEGLCLHLGIVGSTWNRWKDDQKYPEFKEIIETVYERMIGWRKEQVVSRDKVTGLVWDLEVNYGCGMKARDDSGVSVTMAEELEEYSG